MIHAYMWVDQYANVHPHVSMYVYIRMYQYANPTSTHM